MGIEYYLVKPNKQEVFYLGKHMSCPEGISNWSYEKEASYIKYDCWDDFFWDFFRENSDCFNEVTLQVAKEIIYAVYEWCSDGEIYFDHDCHMDLVEWQDWKETGSLIELFEKFNEDNLKSPQFNKNCRWCDSAGDCWYHMPDSKLECHAGSGECSNYSPKVLL